MADSESQTAQETTQAEETKPTESTASVEETKDASKESGADSAAQKEQEAEASESQEVRVVPEKYELKLSENSLLDAQALERVAAFAKAQSLTQEEAQGFLESHEAEVAQFTKERAEAWKKEALADKEIGGEKLNENIALANRAIERFASDSLKKELDKSGYGNHPELVRMFARIGKELANDKAVIPGAGSGQGQRSLEDIFYPKKEGA